MTASSETLSWGSRKTIRRGSAKPGSLADSSDLILNYRATQPSWYCCLPELRAA